MDQDHQDEFDQDFLEVDNLILTTKLEDPEPLKVQLPFVFVPADDQVWILVALDDSDNLPAWAQHLTDHPECEITIAAVDYSGYAIFDELDLTQATDAFVKKYDQEEFERLFTTTNLTPIAINLETNPLTDTDKDIEQ